MTRLSEWPALDLEADGWPAGSIVSTPVFVNLADQVAADAARLGVARGPHLQMVIMAGLAILTAKGPATPEPKFPRSTP